MKARSTTKSVFITYKPELVGLGLLAAALFVASCLLSFHRHDSSLFYYSSIAHPIRNVGGFIGAHLAALLIYLFGAFRICP